MLCSELPGMAQLLQLLKQYSVAQHGPDGTGDRKEVQAKGVRGTHTLSPSSRTRSLLAKNVTRHGFDAVQEGFAP